MNSTHLSTALRAALVVALCLLSSIASAQTRANKNAATSPPSVNGPQYGEPDTIRFRVGAEITASRGACKDIVATVAVPLECPEQTVEIINEDFSPEVADVSYRMLQGGGTLGGVRQMIISVPRLNAGVTARAIIDLKVMTRTIRPPEHTDGLKIPKRVTNDIRPFLNGSPFIDIKHRSIIELAREALKPVDDSATDWQKVEAIYDCVLDKVKYLEGPDKSALEALKDGQADCQGRSMLFIALCRANKIPARMVWVEGHAYPEFYLEEADGKGFWYPCESAGARAFGGMPLARTILQKGDNFKVPERSERLRYASDYLIGVPASRDSGQPTCHFLHQELGR